MHIMLYELHCIYGFVAKNLLCRYWMKSLNLVCKKVLEVCFLQRYIQHFVPVEYQWSLIVLINIFCFLSSKNNLTKPIRAMTMLSACTCNWRTY